jgi:hypothetical protein
MVAFSFRAQFADLVRSRVKRQTVRASQRAKPGDRIQLYTGMRTKACEKLVADDPVCTVVDYCALRPGYITLGNKALHPDADDFARADGFADYKAMLAWFEETYGSPYFVGFVHKWEWPSPFHALKANADE